MSDGRMICLDTADPGWDELLALTAAYDTYHLRSYHKLAESAGEGRGILLIYP